MLRVTAVDESLDFHCDKLGLRVVRRADDESGRFTLTRGGRMAFIRSPDRISIELLQAGEALEPAEPWVSMPNTGYW